MDDDLVLQGVITGPYVQPMISSSTSLNPWPVWVLVLLPLVALTQILYLDWDGYFRAIWQASQLGQRTSLPVGFLIANLVGVLSFIATVVLAYLDWQALRRIGIVRPFHWAWCILLPIVYLIGRAVVLRRRTGRGVRGPVWIYLLVSIIATSIPMFQLVAALGRVLPEIVQEVQEQELGPRELAPQQYLES